MYSVFRCGTFRTLIISCTRLITFNLIPEVRNIPFVIGLSVASKVFCTNSRRNNETSRLKIFLGSITVGTRAIIYKSKESRIAFEISKCFLYTHIAKNTRNFNIALLFVLSLAGLTFECLTLRIFNMQIHF